jgi:hypothetical protein
MGEQRMAYAEQQRGKQARLDLGTMMDEARQATGLTDFGGESFEGPMTRYLDGVAREVPFKSGGLDAFRASMLNHLVNRLRIEEDLRRHPEILEEDVSAPIVVVGLPRTGTTKLQRMLSAAPDVQKLYLWRLLNPAPFPGTAAGEPDPRIAVVQGGKGVGSETMEATDFTAGHEMTAMQVDEDAFLFDCTLDQSIIGVHAHAPHFTDDEWASGTPERESDLEGYRYVRKVLQYLQWQDGGRRGRPWILKTIPHLAHLDALLDCYPDATVVQTHRDPHVVVPSIAKVMYNLYSLSTDVDKKFVGEGMLRWCSNLAERGLDARDRLQLDEPILDVRYEDVRTDAMSIIREVYRRAGRELTPEAQAAMLRWEQDHEQGKRGAHTYSLEEFSLDEGRVNAALGEYAERFSSLF